jgi:hypothetical protein
MKENSRAIKRLKKITAKEAKAHHEFIIASMEP